MSQLKYSLLYIYVHHPTATNMTNDAIIPSINKETLESSTLKVKTELENLTSNERDNSYEVDNNF